MRVRILSAVVVVLIAALAYVVWNKNTQNVSPEVGAVEPGAPAAGSTEGGGMPSGIADTPPAQDAGVEWEKPQRWVEEMASGMRLATYAIPAAQGAEAATCAVYYFGPGQGGGTDANIERWIGEFENPSNPARRERKVRGMSVTQVEVSGTYRAHAGMSSGGSETPSEGWILLGGIVEGPSGALFFKLTGPRATVEPAKKEFDGLLGSLRKK